MYNSPCKTDVENSLMSINNSLCNLIAIKIAIILI